VFDVPFEIGDKVSGKWGGEDENNGSWYPGRIQSINVSAKTIHIVFDDGDEDTALSWEHVIIV